MAIISFTNYKRGQTTGCMGAVMRYTMQNKKKSSNCWHKTQQADSFRCPPVCLTIHKVQKMYLWELSEGASLFGTFPACLHRMGGEEECLWSII